ncbi:MAG: hypothetical protein NT029_12040 [Armatimonadetes bacterium]|nr:hypothetical protein [Armatimonadota bacterium]
MSAASAPADVLWEYVKQVRDRVTAADPGLLAIGNGLVYHYTSLNTLDAATNGGAPGVNRFTKLRASSVAFMNDTREYSYGRDILSGRIDGMLASTTGWRNDVLSAIKALSVSTEPNVFCVCFSVVDDDLSQWRGYADMGRGCVLGIERAPLQEYVSGIGCWVTYDLGRQQRLADELVADYLDTMQVLTKSAQSAVADVASWFSALFPSLCMLFKHHKCGAEREYRVIYSPSGPSATRVQHYRSAGSRIVPYVELDLEGSQAVPLRVVRLGPSAGDPRNIAAIEAMLADRGVALPDGTPVPVLPSDIPFVPTP